MRMELRDELASGRGVADECVGASIYAVGDNAGGGGGRGAFATVLQ